MRCCGLIQCPAVADAVCERLRHTPAAVAAVMLETEFLRRGEWRGLRGPRSSSSSAPSALLEPRLDPEPWLEPWLEPDAFWGRVVKIKQKSRKFSLIQNRF